MRPDLQAKRQKYQGRAYWVVKDPIALQYFRFEEEEFAILQMLDGEASLDEIAERFEAEFPPQTIRTEELQQFIGMLHRSGLVIAGAGGQGEQLKKRRDERAKKELIGRFTNVLSVRFKGFDPERILNLLYSFPPVRWFWSLPALLSLHPVVPRRRDAGAGAVRRVLRPAAPASRSSSPRRTGCCWPWCWAAQRSCTSSDTASPASTSAASATRWGSCCWCSRPACTATSRTRWMLPNRWHRAAIGAAGMYVEVVLASICTFIWWFTEPASMLNHICLNIMFVSSVSTMLFNANPLLRYDGYYILSDVMEIPNLRQKATKILTRKLGDWCLGLEEPEDPFLPKRNQALVRPVHGRLGHLPLGRVVFDPVLPQRDLRAVRPEAVGADDRAVRPVRADRDAVC